MKHFKLFTLTLFLISLPAFSICQSQSYYRFYAPEIENLIPFSKGELQKFKENKIQQVEIKSTSLERRTTYYLNDQGQVTSEETFYTYKKKEFPYAKVIYKYNQNGLLTVRDAKGPYVIAYDTIAYDNKGRIIHYYAYTIYPKIRKKYRVPQIEYDMNLYYSDENKVILFDSTNYEMKFYTLNNQNEFIYRNSDYGIDSVSIDTTNDTEYRKRYWYKHQEDSIFKLGQEFTYKNGLLQTETVWNKSWYRNIIWRKTYYTYNQDNLLMRTENENRYQEKKFYTYFENGLLMEEIIVEQNSVNIYKYIYKYSENMRLF